jgi:predicted membrane protein
MNPQTLIGILIVVAGVLLMGDNLDLFGAGQLLSLWPVGLLAVGVLMYKRAMDPPAQMWAGFVALAGLWMTLSRLFGWPLRLSMLWPIALVVVGITVIQRALLRQQEGPGVSNQNISEFAFWSGVQRRVNSSLFRRADLTAVMGGFELDFRQAAIHGDAVIDLFVFMGGVVIKVPPDWSVSNQSVAIMGGVQDKSTGTGDSKHHLLLRGFVMMGGIEVKT